MLPLLQASHHLHQRFRREAAPHQGTSTNSASPVRATAVSSSAFDQDGANAELTTGYYTLHN